MHGYTDIHAGDSCHNIHNIIILLLLYYVTCSEKRDHSGYFIKIEFLAWIDSFMCAESNGASFMKKISITSGVMTILYTQVDIFVFWKCTHLIKFCIKLYVSEQLFAPKHYDSLQQLHKHSISI